jgi:hypothetical protein
MRVFKVGNRTGCKQDKVCEGTSKLQSSDDERDQWERLAATPDKGVRRNPAPSDCDNCVKLKKSSPPKAEILVYVNVLIILLFPT